MKSFITTVTTGIILVTPVLHFSLSCPAEETTLVPFEAWQKRVEAAPKMLTVADTEKTMANSLIAKDDFTRTYDEFLRTMHTQSSQSHEANWLNKKDESTLFVSKVSVKPEATIVFHGDLHGDIHSLVTLLNTLQRLGYLRQDDGFSIKDEYKDSFYMIFLGDYVDRGWYSLEVLYTLMRLKMANPDNIFLLRGNHEEKKINQRYGFMKELQAKNYAEKADAIHKLYEYFPSALYLVVESPEGKDILQCNHGGLELGFDPRPIIAAPQKQAFQWISHIDRASVAAFIPALQNIRVHIVKKYLQFSGKPNTRVLGFLWDDFIINPRQKIAVIRNRGLTTGKDVTTQVLAHYSSPYARIRGIIRSHEHAARITHMMEMLLQPEPSEKQNLGLARLWKDKTNRHLPPNRLWDGTVCTLNVSPFTPYGVRQELGQFEFDTFVLLRLDEKFENWDLQVHRTFPNRSGA